MLSGKLIRVVLVLTTLVVGASYLAIRSSRTKVEICQICAREIHSGFAYTIELENGEVKVACCPRCGLRFQEGGSNGVRSVLATDCASGQTIEADQAYYVEGSDVHACCSLAPLKGAEGEVYSLHWDRCLPSLVAFKHQEAAREFQAEHGGRILRYEQLIEEIEEKLPTGKY